LKVQEAVNILRRVRHDFANHLQVITGYVELGRAEEIKHYVTGIIEEMAAERRIFELPNAEAVLYLYGQMLLVRDLGIILRYKELDISSADVLVAQNEPYMTLKSLVSQIEAKEDDVMVYLSLHEENDGVINMIVICEQFKQNPLRFKIKE